MNYQISSDNMEVTESMKELAREKLSRIEERFDYIPEGSKSARVVMNTAPVEQFEVRVEINLDGNVFFTDETNYSLETALITAVEELDRQIEKSKLGSEDWEKQREAKRFDPEIDQIEE
jgi:ribosomal subunit interface protein